MSNKLYGERDAIKQGSYYIRHVEAMTAERLHSKADIAAELAHRDILLATANERLREAGQLFADLLSDHETLRHHNIADGLRVSIIAWLAGSAKEGATPNPNTGHGHVRPRPDGVRARCGGPGLCKECSLEAAQLANSAGGSDNAG